jgi:hypothetical protein
MRIACLALLPAALLAAATAVAQDQPPAPGRPTGTMAPVRSPEVQEDGRVTFRLRAPNATNCGAGNPLHPLHFFTFAVRLLTSGR